MTTTYFLDLDRTSLPSTTVQLPGACCRRGRQSLDRRRTASAQRTAIQTTSTKGIARGRRLRLERRRATADAVATFTPSSGVTKIDNANYKGVWSISNLNAGAGTLTISAPGRTTQTFTVTVVGGKTVLAYVTLT